MTPWLQDSFLHSTGRAARPEHLSALDAPMVPISLQLKRKPLTMANKSLHPLPPIPL